MRKSTVAIWTLSFVLLLSNAAWLLSAVYQGYSYTYLDDSYGKARGAALQCFEVVKASADPSATQESIVAAARSVGGVYGQPFDEDVFLWVGDIGLQFDDTGRVVNITASVFPF